MHAHITGGAPVAAAAAPPPQEQPSSSDDDEEDEGVRLAFDGDDDDEFLAGSSMEQLAASIRHALQGKHFNSLGCGTNGKRSASGKQRGEEEEEEAEEEAARAQPESEEDEDSDEEGTIASKKRKLEEKKQKEEERRRQQQAGPNLQRWQPKAELPKQAASSRLVHQREPEKGVEKEKGLAAQLLAPARDPAKLVRGRPELRYTLNPKPLDTLACPEPRETLTPRTRTQLPSHSSSSCLLLIPGGRL